MANSAITKVIFDDEKTVAAALNDLNDRKLDASAYTKSDDNNYVTGGSAKNNAITLNRKDLVDATITGVVTTDKVAEAVNSASNWEAGQGNGAVLLKNSNGSAAGEFSVSEGKGNTASGDWKRY